MEELLDRNRREIFHSGADPWAANRRLAVALMLVFTAVFGVYAAATWLAPAGRVNGLFESQLGAFAHSSLADLQFEDFSRLTAHNLGVAATCFLFAVFYRHAGLLFVLAWNASRWGVILAHLARTTLGFGQATSRLAGAVICVLPHLVLEAMAYILLAMAGVFLSKAATKYELGSATFLRVARAVILLASLGIVVLLAAAMVESHLAPTLVARWLEPL